MGIIAERWVCDQRVHLDVQRATGARRLTGLIGRAELSAGRALLFTRCRSVHSAFMRRPIDVVFTGPRNEVRSVRRLVPWRIAYDARAAAVLELRSGEAARLGIVEGSVF